MTTLIAAEQLIARTLSSLYDSGEARAIGCQLLEHVLRCSRTQLLMLGKDTLLSPEQEESLSMALGRLAQGEPLQYILGRAAFLDFELQVSSGVLIPRPETEELVLLALESLRSRAYPQPRILDVGTGSGCIAYSIAAHMDAEVVALELSPEAQVVAETNFASLYEHIGRQVRLLPADVLQLCLKPCTSEPYNLIISNPPYIHPQEAVDMTIQVLEHEPSMALFAPEHDPLAFYKALAYLAQNGWLAPQGEIWAEINPLFAEEILREMCAILTKYQHTAWVHRDMSGRERFIHIKLD